LKQEVRVSDETYNIQVFETDPSEFDFNFVHLIHHLKIAFAKKTCRGLEPTDRFSVRQLETYECAHTQGLTRNPMFCCSIFPSALENNDGIEYLLLDFLCLINLCVMKRVEVCTLFHKIEFINQESNQ